jgi:hypothetical protein
MSAWPTTGGSLEITNRRLRAQRIAGTTFTQAREVVGWLGAVQAQDYLGALWAIGLRTTETRENDVERALAAREIVRTWPMRGTLHFVAAADARWMIELLAARPAAAAAGRLRSLRIDEADLAAARRVLVRHLEGGRHLTRPATYRALEQAKVATGGQRGLHLLWRLAQDCVICFGPREGKQQTFVLFEEWLPRARRLPREEALAELAHRYFRGHGPATMRDFAWWSGLRLAEARLAVLLAGKRLEEETIHGERHWFTESAGPSVVSHGGAYALPAFDELLVGYTDRGAVLDAARASLVIAGGAFQPIVVGDGRVLGTWKRRIKAREVVCALAPFTALGRTKAKATTLAFGRYARFLGLDLRRERDAVVNDGR